jgi:hypothetical protein
MPGEDDDTLMTCRACGGHWKIRGSDGKEVLCRWCRDGYMSGKELAHWLAHKSGPRKLS